MRAPKPSRKSAANELAGAVHDRMPAIIPIVEHPRWLGPDPDPSDLLKPYPARLMKRVSKLLKRR
jgi:putative SOS response-associated peptidase YedK